MQQVYPDEGLVELITRMLASSLHLHLFVNDLTPSFTTVLLDMTEATFGGYSVASLLIADWAVMGVSAHNGYALAAPKSFLNSSGIDQAAYGYYFTDVSDSMLIAATRFDSAPVTKHDGESFLVFPTWGDFSQFG